MDDQVPVGSARIPLWLKVAYTLFTAVLLPVYWFEYGPLNYLWFCDVALLVTLVALWTESPLLASTQAVAIVFPQTLWVLDFLIQLATGIKTIGLSDYMFDARISTYVRGLSLFHGWLPFLLVWLVWRLGYDRRAFLVQTLISWAVLLASFTLTTDPTGPAGNVNKVFGLDDQHPQTWMPRWQWLAVLMAFYPLVIFLPSHLVLRMVFRPPGEKAA
jgi:hypothetical protein